ncbi:putative dimethylaniline monooxygenase protein [Seiridium unicorne]|uniref:Dimethylaniline monooxygenase protein n=1 Tax=Seiridium unicorne TaxID=138068 RepID=A0ABR2UWV8_9PEZI
MGAIRRYPGIQGVVESFIPAGQKALPAKHQRMTDEKVTRHLAIDTDRPDFMTSLLKNKNKQGALTDPELSSGMFSTIVAGSETTATALSATFYLLSKNTEKLKKLNEEIRSTFEADDQINMLSTNSLNRYASLSLHGPTFTNHLPCVPFPQWFPVFLPAQQLWKFLQNYAEIMDLNIWTRSVIDGKNAVYAETAGKWTISVTRGDGSMLVLHTKHLMVATGISGTLPNVPQVPGMTEFEQNGGIVAHPSRHRTASDWKGKKCIVVGAATSAHDISYELHENGFEVTMIQRSATHVMSVEKSVRALFKGRESTNRRGGLAADLMDQSNCLRQVFPVEYQLLPRGQKKTQELDADLLQSLRDVGYRLHDGYHGGGACSVFLFDQGGFDWDTGPFTKGGVVFKDGTDQEADIVVFATGYMNSKSAIQALMGDDMAKKCNERWEKGNAFFIGPEGESIVNYCPLPQKGLYSMFHQFSFSRFHSARLALRIKAGELGIDVTPYGNKPVGPPSTAAGRQPRP